MSGPTKPRHGGAVLSAFAEMVRHTCAESGRDNARHADEAHARLSEYMTAAKREWEATLAALAAAEERAEAAEKRGIAPWLVEERDAWKERAEESGAFAAGEVEKARAAMDHGADDSRWRPGETAVDALIRERDEALALAGTRFVSLERAVSEAIDEGERRAVAEDERDAANERADALRAEIAWHDEQRVKAVAEREQAERERDEARAQLANLEVASAAALCDALASTAEFAAKTRREIRAETLREAADAANEPTGAAAAYEARRRLVDRLRAIADAAERGQ